MATTTSTPPGTITWEAFERLPDGDGLHREILEGELQVLPPPKLHHTRIAKRVLKALLALEEQGLSEALPEAGYKISENPATWIQPDVSFLRAERVRSTEIRNYAAGAPDLAVEIVSPSETARDLQRKVGLLLGAGSRAVWVVYPETQTVIVHLPDGSASTRIAGEKLSASFLLEGWELPVAALFQEAG